MDIKNILNIFKEAYTPTEEEKEYFQKIDSEFIPEYDEESIEADILKDIIFDDKPMDEVLLESIILDGISEYEYIGEKTVNYKTINHSIQVDEIIMTKLDMAIMAYNLYYNIQNEDFLYEKIDKHDLITNDNFNIKLPSNFMEIFNKVKTINNG